MRRITSRSARIPHRFPILVWPPHRLPGSAPRPGFRQHQWLPRTRQDSLCGALTLVRATSHSGCQENAQGTGIRDNDFLLYSQQPATLPRTKRVQHYKRDRTGIRGSTAHSSHQQVGRIQSEPAPIPRRLSTVPPGAYRWPRDYPGTHSASRLPIRTLCGPCRIRVRNPAFAARRRSNSVDV